ADDTDDDRREPRPAAIRVLLGPDFRLQPAGTRHVGARRPPWCLVAGFYVWHARRGVAWAVRDVGHTQRGVVRAVRDIGHARRGVLRAVRDVRQAGRGVVRAVRVVDHGFHLITSPLRLYLPVDRRNHVGG